MNVIYTAITERRNKRRERRAEFKCFVPAFVLVVCCRGVVQLSVGHPCWGCICQPWSYWKLLEGEIYTVIYGITYNLSIGFNKSSANVCKQ